MFFFLDFICLSNICPQCGAWTHDPEIKSNVHTSPTEPVRRPSFKIFLIQGFSKYTLEALLVSYLEMKAGEREQVPTNINGMVKGFKTM